MSRLRARVEVWRARLDLFSRAYGWRDVEALLIVLAVAVVWGWLVIKIAADLAGIGSEG